MIKLISILITFAFASSAWAEDYVEWVGANSGVNWSEAQVQAEGAGVGPTGAPPATAQLMACRAAVLDAQRNLLESIKGVRVQGTTVVANMMTQSDTIKTSIDGVLRGAQIIKRDPQSDGSCIVRMTAPLAGQFAKTVYSKVFAPQPVSRADSPMQSLAHLVDAGMDFLVPKAYADMAQPAPPPWQAAIDKLSSRINAIEDLLSAHPEIVNAGNKGPTGLVIDARGSNFIPSMSPKIRELRGGVIYPNVKHEAERRERGQLVSLFTRDIDTARRHPVVGERPIVLKGLRTFGSTRTEIVLDHDASQQLEDLVAKGFLNDAGVIIVL
ncbi:MAG TPA: LPP20 family lipoprotein [Pseudomonadales bacterium]|nr:LPP20 family lipoprotein [Pseudomonadales bacterium]